MAALLTKLLPPLGASGRDNPTRYKIDVYADEDDEVMHGIGLRLSSHYVDAVKGEQTISGSCARAEALSQAEKKVHYYSLRPTVSYYSIIIMILIGFPALA